MSAPIGTVTITVELPESPDGYSDTIEYSIRPDGVRQITEVHDGYHHFSHAEIDEFVARAVEVVAAVRPFGGAR